MRNVAKLLLTLIIILPSFAMAGASDGSEILGKIIDPTEKKNIIKTIREIFKKETEAPFNDEIALDCTVTPDVNPDHISLKEIGKSSNLIRKAGAARRANGQYIQVKGKVVDEDCLPISNATIKIWQADSTGKYAEEYELKSEWDVRDKNFDANFAYSGTAHTNNLGDFYFLTVLPAASKPDIAPHINLTIKHDDFQEKTTMMFFNKHPKNSNDINLNNIEKDKRRLLIAKGNKLDPSGNTGGREYVFQITLEGENKYRRY